MAKSTDHSLNRDLYSASEESGWTLYFDDFLASRNEAAQQELNPASSSISTASITSLASDAASHVARKSTVNAGLSLKKRKVKGVSYLEDDSLEDTACSPINSPKVGGMEEDAEGVSRINEEKGFDSVKCGLMDYMKRTSECTELKEMELCLSSSSNFVDFLSKRFT